MQVVFSTKRRTYDPHRDTLACSADCPACNTEVHFWATNRVAHSTGDTDEVPSLYMMPDAPQRLDLQPLADLLPSNVMQFCQSAQDVFDSGNLTATSIMVQSAIDAIFTGFLPDGNSKTTLSRLIHDSIESMDLDFPLQQLSRSLRPDGHMQELFTNNENVNRETADAQIRLVEKLVTYLYVIPGEFKQLDKELENLSVLNRKPGSGKGQSDTQAAA